MHDEVDQFGDPSQDDPRVGTLGISYGGGMQYALASVDPRVDALVPMETFNDLEYSLYPNAAEQTDGVQSPVAGVAKSTWGLGLVATGQLASSITGLTADPYRTLQCQYMRGSTCADMIAANLRGYADDDLRAYYERISPHASIPNIAAPVLLIQGEYDTLFSLNEALASYRQLEAQGNTVRLVWASLGHNGGSLDDFSSTAASLDQPVNARIMSWFGHWLKDDGSDLGSAFTYTEPWADTLTTSAADDPDAFARQTFFLGASGTLATSPVAADAANRTQTLVTNAGALPTTVGHLDILPLEPTDDVYSDYSLPGTQATWTSDPLTSDVDVVGVPTATLTVSTPLAAWRAQPGNTGNEVTLYLKIYDVAPDGTRGVVGSLSTPIRIDDTRQQVQVNLQGIIHRFAAGHSIAFAVAGGDLNFRGGTTPATVTIDAGVDGQTLSLPVAG
ncbi:MAG: CocE/NonD family hydrolase [Microbacterium sp.]